MLDKLATRFLWPKVRPKGRDRDICSSNADGNGKSINRIGSRSNSKGDSKNRGSKSCLKISTIAGLGAARSATLGIASSLTLGFISILGGLGSSNALAANQPTATIAINNGSAIDSQTIEPTNSTGASKVISVPVKTTFTYTSTYTMGVGLDCSELTGTKLTNCQAGALVGNEATSALAGTTDGSTTTEMRNQNNSTNTGGAWGYGVDKTGGNTTPSTYNRVPVGSNTNNVISATDSTGSNTAGKVNAGATQTNKTVTLFFAAGVNGNQASDTYQGNILVTVVAEPITLLEWAIEYDLDGGTWSGPNTGNQSGTAGAGEESVPVNLRSVIPTKTVGGTTYVFDKWKDVDAGTLYAANASVTLTLAKPTLRLKAQWTEVPTMQNFKKAQCEALTPYTGSNESAVIHLTDSRDNKSYLVGKLADGKCWMLQNLALKTGITLTSDDSDVSSNYPLQEATGWSSDTTAYAINGGHQDNTKDTAVTTNGTFTANTGSYYSFLTATAGTGTGSSGNAPSSICPKGWKLPTGGSGGQFETLYNSDASNFNTAFKVAATGYCGSSGCPVAYNYAGYWSSTIANASVGYFLESVGSDVNPACTNGKRYGYSVRCILVAS